jgi:hypothetical protein
MVMGITFLSTWSGRADREEAWGDVRRELAAVNGREVTVNSMYAPRERLATGCG